jgi:hypothetical protein
VAFRKRRFQAEWRKVRSPLLVALLTATPILIFLGAWVRDRIVGEPFRWGQALLVSLGLPTLIRVKIWLDTGPLFARVQLTDAMITWNSGKSCYRLEALQTFILSRGPDYTVLVLQTKKGKPILLGVPHTVLSEELAAFLQSRGLEQRFDQNTCQPTLPAATS